MNYATPNIEIRPYIPRTTNPRFFQSATILTINCTPIIGPPGFTSNITGNLSVNTLLGPLPYSGEQIQLQINIGTGWQPFGPQLVTDLNGNYSLSVPWTGMSGTFQIRAYYAGNPNRSQYLVETTTNPITITITGGSVSGKITAIRVQDIARQKWFNWNNGSWDANGTPYVTPGANSLYIAFYATNIGTVGGNLTLDIISVTESSNLETKTVYVAAGASVGIEWTGNMLYTQSVINLTVTP